MKNVTNDNDNNTSEKLKLFDSELKVMEILWEEGEIPAKQIAGLLSERIGWNKNTTYTVIKKCIQKEAVERSEPNFLCRPLLTKEEVQSQEIENLVNKMFSGSETYLFSHLLDRQDIPEDMLIKLRALIEKER